MSLDETLAMRVESYEVAAEGQDRTRAIDAIDYRANVDTTGPPRRSRPDTTRGNRDDHLCLTD